MFLIDPLTNSIKSIDKKSFSSLGFKERQHLQEWIVSHPESLGEELLIIQKEFDGFQETNERLDLLALDKSGNLVIIENKLDDSGRDVTWQSLKYASYASTLTKENIRNIFQSYLNTKGNNEDANERLSEFYNNKDIIINRPQTQRIFLVAANFRKEVTSTVLWLLNFKVQLKCFKVTPYQLGDQYILNVEQIIPTKDTQDYVISMANKVHEELIEEVEIKNRHQIRLEFWAVLLKNIKGKSSLFQNSKPSKDHWIVAGGTGITYVSYQLIVTQSNASVCLNMGRPSKDDNKLIFDELFKNKQKIENLFGTNLIWDRSEVYKSSKIYYVLPNVNYFDREDWQQIIDFLIANINKLEFAFRDQLKYIKTILSTDSTGLIDGEAVDQEQVDLY